MTTSLVSYKMDPEIKAKWVEALRSGKYKQGQKRLRVDVNIWCCLGVLADINGEEWESYLNEHYIEYWRTVNGADIFYTGNGSLLLHPQADILAQMNDRGASFDEIADYIEENL